MSPRKDKVAKIIVVQVGGMSASVCKEEADELGLTDKEIVFFRRCNDTDCILAEVNPDEEQILVTGTFHGDRQEADDFVREAKKKSAKLKAWFCSLVGDGDQDQLYDHVVQTGLSYEHYWPMLEKAIEELAIATR